MTIRYHPASALRLFSSALSPKGQWGRTLGIDKSKAGLITASAADAISLALSLIGGTGRVIVPAYTCDRVIGAIASADDIPWLVDVEPKNGSYLRDNVMEALTKSPKAILLTKLFGVDNDAKWLIQSAARYRVPVIEDTALLLDMKGRAGLEPSVSVYSFGRGKPLSLGGGGAIVVRDAQMSKQLEQVADTWCHCSTLGLAKLSINALRDGAPALWLAAQVARHRQIRPRLAWEKEGILSMTPTKPSPSAERAIANLVERTDYSALERTTRSAIKCYKKAFKAKDIEISSQMGERLPAGTISPALAFLSTERDSIVVTLAKSGLDCPRYWSYSVANRMGLSGFSGAETLSRSLFFLPLHRRINQRIADKVATILTRYSISTFS